MCNMAADGLSISKMGQVSGKHDTGCLETGVHYSWLRKQLMRRRFLMVKTTTGYVDLDDGKLYYEMAGDGDTFVLGHAGFVDSRMWDDQWETFTQRYQVIRYDMRGYGKSDPAHGPVNRREI